MAKGWGVVYLAHGKNTADSVFALLQSKGYPVKIRALYKNQIDEKNYFEIMVPAAEAEEAMVLLVEDNYSI